MPIPVLTPDVDREHDTQAGLKEPNGAHLTSSRRNVRMFERVFPQRSPDPPRQGDTPARPARWPMFVSQAWAEYHSIMEDEFQFLVWAPELQIQQLPGIQSAFSERSNIRKPAAEAYGSLFEMEPYSPYSFYRVPER